MKETTFTTEQRNLLQECLKKRLSYNLKEIDKKDKRYYNSYVKLLVLR